MIGLPGSRSRGPKPIPHEDRIHSIADPDEVEVKLEYPGHIRYLPEVKPGDFVYRNQSVGRSQMGNHVHASLNGKVQAIRTVWSPYSHHVPAVAIRRVDLRSTTPSPISREADAAAHERPWLHRLKRAGVAVPWTLPGRGYREIDLGEIPATRVVVIKGVHEEPTIFTSQLLLHESPERVRAALGHLAEIAPGATVWLTVSRRDAEWARTEFGGLAKIAALPDSYRGRIERHVVPRLVGERIPNTTAYRRHGVVVMPLEYFLALQCALDNGQPFIRKCLTIAGDGIEKVVTVRVPIGISIRAVLASQGISTEGIGRVVVGGPMRGVAQFSDRISLTHVDGLYLLAPDSVPVESNDPCINCGRCTRACPASIQVHLVNRFAESGRFEEARRYHPEACHACGFCAYVCPARRSLVQLMRMCKPKEF